MIIFLELKSFYGICPKLFAISIWQKSFVLAKYAPTWNALAMAICQQLWQYQKVCTIVSGLTFNYFFLLLITFNWITLLCLLQISLHRCRHCASQKRLFPSKICIIKYLIRPIYIRISLKSPSGQVFRKLLRKLYFSVFSIRFSTVITLCSSTQQFMYLFKKTSIISFSKYY